VDEYKLYDAELRLMDLVWTLEPVNSTQLSRLCLERFGWKKPTTFNLIRKRERRGGRAGIRRVPARLCIRLFNGTPPLPGGR